MESINSHQDDVLISRKALCEMTGVGIKMSFNLHCSKSKYFDPMFPSRIKIGVRAVRFSKLATLEWIEGKKKQSIAVVKTPFAARQMAA